MLRMVLAVGLFWVLSLGGCASAPGEKQGGRFEFALIGDTPYDARQERSFRT
jgi:hypothetical protein